MSKFRSIGQHIQGIYRYAEDPENLNLLLDSFETSSDADVAEEEVFELLAPHFDSALSIAKLRDFPKPDIEVASLTVDTGLKLLSANTQGFELLSQMGLYPAIGHQFCDDDSELWATLKAAKRSFRERGASSFVYSTTKGRGVVGRFVPLSNHKTASALTLTLLAWGAEHPIDLSGLGAFNLTRAEKRLVTHLARGETLIEAARSIGVSDNTVRSQVKSVYQKTGCNSLPSLIALTHMGNTLAKLTASLNTAEQIVQTTPRQTYDLPNGRKLAFRTYGDELGQPVLILTGGFAASYLSSSKNIAAKSMGLSLLAPDRPGTGMSDRDPKRSLESWASDLANFLQRQSDEPIPILVNAHMAKTAFVLASVRPDLVSSILFINPRFDEIEIGSQSARTLDPIGQRLMNVALRQPRLVTPVIRLFLKQTPMHVRARLVKLIMSSTPADREYLDDAANLNDVLQSISDAQIETSAGFGDDILMLSNSQFSQLETGVCCEAWFGEELAPPALISAAKRFIPNIECKVLPNYGQMMFHSEFCTALNWLRQAK